MVADFIELDKNSKTPVWEQIYRALAEAAESGERSPRARGCRLCASWPPRSL